MTGIGLDPGKQHNPMIMNMIIRIKEKGFSGELKTQYVVNNMTCETDIVLSAILGLKLGSIVSKEIIEIKLGL